MRSNCGNVKKLISGYVNGDLNPRERTMVADHVLSCDKCRIALNHTRELVDELRQLREKSTVDLWPGVSSQISGRTAVHKRRFGRFGSALGWGALGVPAAAAAAVLFMVAKSPEAPRTPAPTPKPAPTQQMASAEYQAYVQAYSRFRSTQPLSDRATIPAAAQLQRLKKVPR